MDPAKKEELKKLMEDPAKRTEMLKKGFEAMDTEKKGYVTMAQFQEGMKKQAEYLGMPTDKQPTEEQKAQGKKVLDPNGEDKITFENFEKFFVMMSEMHKKMNPNA